MPQFSELCQLKYKDQAIWFLNGFWGDTIDGAVANDIYKYYEKFVELDRLGHQKLGQDGHELDKFWSAKFLEDMDKAMTSVSRKEALKKIDHDNNGNMAMIEYLVWKYDKSVEETVVAPQGDNSAAIAEAQKKIDAVQQQLQETERKIEAQKQAKQQNEQAIAANEKAIAENEKAIADLKQAEDDLRQAEIEQNAAIEDLKRQEKEYADKCASLEALANDPNCPTVKKNKAANELAQLKNEDPLPLRRAKITQEAALRKVQKQQKATEQARVAAEGKARQLEDAAAALEEAGRKLQAAIAALEEAYNQLEAKMEEARQELEKVKAHPGGGKGAIWWMEHDLFEADKRLPTSKQRYNHREPFLFNP